MELLTSLLNQTHGIWLIALIAGGAVALAAYGAMSVPAVYSDPLRRRIQRLGSSQAENRWFGRRLGESLKPLGLQLAPRKEKERETLRKQLIRAGFRSDLNTATAAVGILKIGLLLGLPLITVIYMWSGTQYGPAAIFLAGAIAALIGMLVPNWYLRRRIRNRQEAMMRGLPDALDLLVSCTEAGLGLNAAIQRVTHQLNISCPLLAQELDRVNAEIRGGVDRITALRNMVDRTGLEDLRPLIAMLSQSMRFGTSIADVLRIYSDEYRDKRTQRIEEEAATVGTRLIFPLTFCIFPFFFIIAVGPAVISLVRALSESSF